MALPIGAAVMKAVGGPLQHGVRDRITMREKSNYSAHADASPLALWSAIRIDLRP